jgi:hypothetical protein
MKNDGLLDHEKVFGEGMLIDSIKYFPISDYLMVNENMIEEIGPK